MIQTISACITIIVVAFVARDVLLRWRKADELKRLDELEHKLESVRSAVALSGSRRRG